MTTKALLTLLANQMEIAQVKEQTFLNLVKALNQRIDLVSNTLKVSVDLLDRADTPERDELLARLKELMANEDVHALSRRAFAMFESDHEKQEAMLADIRTAIAKLPPQ